jgi:hypothetical protein
MSAAPIQVSFEFFPPKTEKLEEQLWACIQRLGAAGPRFVSVTYGAGGSTRERTHQTVVRLRRRDLLTPAAHLTCVGATRDEVDAVPARYWEAGHAPHRRAARRPPGGGGDYTPHPRRLRLRRRSRAGLKRIGRVRDQVAAYPEMHPEAVSAEADLDFLKRKIDAGATRAITQYSHPRARRRHGHDDPVLQAGRGRLPRRALRRLEPRLRGNNDLLNLTQPDAIREIHLAYFQAGADIVETNTFSSTDRPGRLRHGGRGLRAERAGARLAREAADAARAADGRRPRFVAGAIGPTNRTASISPTSTIPATAPSPSTSCARPMASRRAA